jgi:hypothetical protein
MDARLLRAAALLVAAVAIAAGLPAEATSATPQPGSAFRLDNTEPCLPIPPAGLEPGVLVEAWMGGYSAMVPDQPSHPCSGDDHRVGSSAAHVRGALPKHLDFRVVLQPGLSIAQLYSNGTARQSRHGNTIEESVGVPSDLTTLLLNFTIRARPGKAGTRRCMTITASGKGVPTRHTKACFAYGAGSP